MFRHEWFKIRNNRKLLLFILLLLSLNGVYFRYRAEQADIPAHAYKNLTAELKGKSPEEGLDFISGKWHTVRTALFGDDSDAAEYHGPDLSVKPEYCDTLWEENTLCSLVYNECNDVVTYPEYLRKVIESESVYKRMTSLFGGDESILSDIEKTSRDYERLDGLTISFTGTKCIAEALSLPSVIFLEMLTAILLASILFAKEKEQGLMRLYSSMYHGRGRMFGARVAAVSLGVMVSNLLFFLTTILAGCALYGTPVRSFLSEPLQSLSGYRTSALPVSIGTFLLLSYLWTCLVTILVAILAAVLSILLSSAMKVYLILFAGIGIEGVLYLTIGKRDYRSVFRRINLVSFADSGYSLGEYHNETVFGTPYSYWVVALTIMLVIGILLFMTGYVLSERGTGLLVRKRTCFRHKANPMEEHISGSHGSVLLHEAVKLYRYEKTGAVLLLALLYVLIFTKPYHNYFGTNEQVFYQTYIARLSEVEPEDYEAKLMEFREELASEERKMSDSRMLKPKQDALTKTEEYVSYLLTKPGAKAVDSRGYELLYKDRKKNVMLGVCAILAAILCGTALLSVEYRSGMADLVRISPERGKSVRAKLLLLLVTVVAFFALIYLRYIWQVVKGYGTGGISLQANSIRDWADVSPDLSIRAKLCLLYLKRFAGMALAAVIAMLLTRKLKNFLLTAVVALVILVVPLLLCLTEVGAVEWLSLNWFFT